MSFARIAPPSNGKGLLATLLLMVAFALPGCAGHIGSTVARNPTSFAAPDVTDRSAVGDSYRLGALDTVTVNQPGIYPITGDMSLVQAIATAKGSTGDALISRVVIFRKINGKREAALFDLKRIRRGDMPDPPVYGNDVVVVDGSRVRQTYRDLMSTLPAVGLFAAAL